MNWSKPRSVPVMCRLPLSLTARCGGKGGSAAWGGAVLAVRGVLDSEGGMCALCSFLSMYFFKSGPVAAGMGTEGDEGSPVLRVAEEIVSAGREREGRQRRTPRPRHTCLGDKRGTLY